MGKGRSPCCDKTQVKRGPWSPCEDLRLIAFIQKNGHDNWRALPKQAGLLRCGKSCRLRWINYLRPDVKRGNFTREEEDSILRLHEAFGNKWSKIAAHFPGRTDNEIKNVWNTHLKKRLASRNISKSCGDDQSKELSSVTFSSPSSSSNNSFLSGGKPSVREELLVEHQSADQEISMATTNEPHETCSLTIQDKLNEDLPVELANQFKLDPKDLKELTCSFSASSNESDGSNSSQVLGVSRPEEPMDFLFDFARLCDDIPFESDFEFWNMLNGLVPSVPPISQSIDQVLQVHETHEAATHQRSDLGQVESDKWLSYLESQLGLEAQATTKSCDCQNNLQEILTKDVTADQAQLVPETFQSYCDKILPNPAAEDHNMAFFAKQFCHLD